MLQDVAGQALTYPVGLPVIPPNRFGMTGPDVLAPRHPTPNSHRTEPKRRQVRRLEPKVRDSDDRSTETGPQKNRRHPQVHGTSPTVTHEEAPANDELVSS